MSTGLINFDYSGVTTENSAICVFFLIRYCDSVVLVTLTAILLSYIVDIEWEISRFAVSIKFSNGVTVLVLLQREGLSTKTVIVFVVHDGIVRASWVETGWSFAFVSLEAVMACIVKCGNCKRPCVVSMTTLLLLLKWNLMIGPVKFSANVLSPCSNLKVVVANGLSNWPFATCIRKLWRPSILRKLPGTFCFIESKSFWAIALT